VGRGKNERREEGGEQWGGTGKNCERKGQARTGNAETPDSKRARDEQVRPKVGLILYY